MPNIELAALPRYVLAIFSSKGSGFVGFTSIKRK
jgi:hypothetical protein